MSHENASEPKTRPGFLSTPEEIVNEARNGRMFILVDDEDRENEGDLVIPAQMATPDAINFMARYGRGLICLALSKQRAVQLQLNPMSRENGTRHATAFTVSIEAREGVTTGISAMDRARTIAAAIDPARGDQDIVSPGHVFPLVAREGGVLVRAGHTEAAVDVSRLAGLNPSGVICEIMKDDGSMARLSDLIPFAQTHGLKIATIRDLIAYRRRNDHLVEKVTEAEFNSRYGGRWRAITYRNKALKDEGLAIETLVLVKGNIDPTQPTLVRMHAFDVFSDSLGEIDDRAGLLTSAMEIIAEHGSGSVVLINRQVPDRISRLVRARAKKPTDPGGMDELRDYGLGAQILADLGVQNMILLSNSQHMPVALSGYGLNIIEQRSFPNNRH